MTKQCQFIIKSEVLTLEASAVGNVVSAVLILYFLYMIYSDWLEEAHFGRIRQQIWAFLHFPLHLFQVLAVEGASQAIAWRAATVARYRLEQEAIGFEALIGSSNATFWHRAAEAMDEAAEDVLEDLIYVASDLDRALAVGTAAEIINRGIDEIHNGAQHVQRGLQSVRIVYASLCVLLYEVAGFHSAQDYAAIESVTEQESLDQLEEVLWQRGMLLYL